MEIRFLNLKVGDKEVKLPASFSANAFEKLGEEFSSITEWVERLKAADFKAVSAAADLVVQSGYIACEAVGIECPPRIKCRPSDLISPADEEIIAEIFSIIKDHMKRNVEVSSKN